MNWNYDLAQALAQAPITLFVSFGTLMEHDCRGASLDSAGVFWDAATGDKIADVYAWAPYPEPAPFNEPDPTASQ